MFIGPWDQGGPFGLEGIAGIERWLNRVWNLVQAEPRVRRRGRERRAESCATSPTRRSAASTEDIEHFRFNTMIAALMEMTNALTQARDAGPVDREAWSEAIEALLLMLAPLAPHIAEELWERTGRPYSVHTQSWPEWDADLAREDEVTLVVQVNGKVRDRIHVPAGIDEDAREAARPGQRAGAEAPGRQGAARDLRAGPAGKHSGRLRKGRFFPALTSRRITRGGSWTNDLRLPGTLFLECSCYSYSNNYQTNLICQVTSDALPFGGG